MFEWMVCVCPPMSGLTARPRCLPASHLIVDPSVTLITGIVLYSGRKGFRGILSDPVKAELLGVEVVQLSQRCLNQRGKSKY